MSRSEKADAGVSRRQFIVSSAAAGGFLLGFSLPLVSKLAQAANGAGQVSATTSVSAWIRIGTDERITILVGSSEMGQGVISALPQIVAEDLMVDWDKVSGEHAPPGAAFVNPGTGSQLTGGSMSVRGYYQALREAGATVRDMLVMAAANQWGLAFAQCSATGHGSVANSVDTRTATYGQLAAAAALLVPPLNPALVPDAQLRLIGTSVPRPDLPMKVDGSAIFGIDAHLPNMLYAVIRHCPALGGSLSGTPPTPPGAIAAIGLGNAVAVVAIDTWQAIKAAEELQVNWSIPPSSDALTTSQILLQAQQLLVSGTPAIAEDISNVESALAGASHRVDLVYDVPYLAHATLEPMNCTVSVTPTACEIWAPTQAAGFIPGLVASLTGLSAEQVTLHTTFLGGGLGRKFEMDYIRQAVQVSMAMGQPVKLTWQREEDFCNDQYRPMAMVRLRAGLDAAGNITAWWYRNVSASILYQRGWIGPDSVDSQAVDGSIELPYAFASRRVEYVRHPAPIPVGFWRSVGHSINAFMVESAIDELALIAGQGPLEYRRRLLAGDTRSLAVLDAAAALAGWDTPAPAGRARGIAFHASFGSVVAQVVELSGSTPSTIKVWRVSCVIDCGRAINPDTVEAQMQGGIVHGMTAALWGKMSFQSGRPSPRNFNNYKMMRMRDMPQVDVQVIQSGAALGGTGEPGVPPIAPAIANAYAMLNGVRLRTLPLTGTQTPRDSIFSDDFE
jgi:isoquinoline 1-oxidoreductase subunit beta